MAPNYLDFNEATAARNSVLKRLGQAPIIEMGDGFKVVLDPITHGKMNDCDIRREKNVLVQEHKKKKAADRLRAKLAKRQAERQ
jgi:hypothetical protein